MERDTDGGGGGQTGGGRGRRTESRLRSWRWRSWGHGLVMLTRTRLGRAAQDMCFHLVAQNQSGDNMMRGYSLFKAIVRRTESQDQEQQPYVEPGDHGGAQPKVPIIYLQPAILGASPSTCPRDSSETQSQVQDCRDHPSARGTLSPLRGQGGCFPKETPQGHRRVETPKGSGPGRGMALPGLTILQQRTWDK